MCEQDSETTINSLIFNRRILAGLLWLVVASAGAADAGSRRVLLLHSFSRDFAPFNAVASNFRAELIRQSPTPVDFYEVSLESARLPGASPEGPFLNYLLALFAGQRLDLVVPLGGPAARFAQRHRQLLFPATPMLLAATDQRHLQYAVLTTNDALVAITIDPPRTMDTILQLLPQTTNVVVILGNSSLEQFWLGELRRQLHPFTHRVTLNWFNELSFVEMLRRCAALPPRSAILFALLSVDADGVPHHEERALSQLHEVANAPLFGFFDTQLGRGIVGGPLVAHEELSRQTAAAALRILAGESPGHLRPPPQGPASPRFDWRELQRWGISENHLPPGSAILFRQPTVWELHKWRIVAIVSLCLFEAFLIVLLLISLARRRRAERSLRESEERLNLAAAAADLGVWMWDIARNEVWATANWRRMFGFPAGAVLRFETVLQRIHPADRAAVEQAVRRAVEKRADYSGEYRVVLPDGALRWIAVRGRLDATARSKRARMLGASVDVTERRRAEESTRDLTGRLITAQEEERARLARELHDDITQRLARLAIDVGRCEQGTPELTPAETAREVREGLVRLSDDVHALSYRLHPSVLEDLGLAEALRAETDRFTRRESISVQLELHGIPGAVPDAAALCLFRVAQEALQNIARHARARAVELTLRALDGGLQLAVRDDGRGFDPVVQRKRPSLGLASMRERVHLLGGELDLESAPGQGTTVLAWVPLQARP